MAAHFAWARAGGGRWGSHRGELTVSEPGQSGLLAAGGPSDSAIIAANGGVPATELLRIPPDWNLPAGMLEQLGEYAGRQRAIIGDGHLLLILQALPQRGESDRDVRCFWRKPDGTWLSHPRAGGVPALDRMLKEYEDKIEELEEAENAAKVSVEYNAVLEELIPILRAVRGVHRSISQAQSRFPKERNLLLWRDDTFELERLAELAYQDAQQGIHFIAASQAERHTRATNRLNTLIALFLPTNTLAALFGMNLHTGMEQHRMAWLLVLVAGTAIGIAMWAGLRHRQ